VKVLGVELPRSYNRPQNGTRLVVGVDVESMTNGYAFLVCDSNGRHSWIRSFDDIIDFFNYEDYAYCLLVAFNLNFDASVMLKWLGEERCAELVNTNKVSLVNCSMEYIPSKYLQFRFGNRFVRVFDVAQFFEGSLDYNAKQYLGMSKINVGSKTFGEKDYGRKDLITYCSKDAVLTQGLGEYVVTAFDKLGVNVQSLASPANILEAYVLDQLLIRNHVHQVPQGALEFAMLSFSGAWFENFKSGHFPKTYRYDIVSAYPAVIRDLVDLSVGTWYHCRERPEGALYGYVYAKVNVPRTHISPIVFKNMHDSIARPYGDWTAYFTVQEIDWLRCHGGSADVLDAWWYVPYTMFYSYRSVVDKFFSVKRKSAEGTMEKWSSKIALVGMYGKFLQHKRGYGGRLYNPIYATEITSRVRLSVADVCLKNPDAVIAVMSDCVVSNKPLDVPKGRDIGDWSVKGPGDSLWLGPVQYEAEGRPGGFRRIQWTKLLKDNPSLVDYEVVRVGPLTLLQGVRLKRFDDVGVFKEQSVTFNIRKLNWKRYWPKRPSCGGDLLSNQYESKQLCVSSRLKEEELKLWEL